MELDVFRDLLSAAGARRLHSEEDWKGERVLGVPTVGDRIAQMVIKQMIGSRDWKPSFLPDFYGYRPGKSALDAVGVTRQRCWKFDWVLEFDIKGLFDNLPHDLLLKAVRKHVTCKWALLYIERWLAAPMEKNGEVVGGEHAVPRKVASSAPILLILFMHYAFDLWMTRTHPDLPWCRYADDGLVHCRSEQQAEAFKVELGARLAACGLQMHPTKTKIVYCKDQRRRGKYPNVVFDFLGYQFRPRRVANTQRDEFFCGYTPAASPTALKSMRATIKSLNIPRQTPGTLAEIAQQLNPLLRGWIADHGPFSRSALSTLADYVNRKLRAWIMRKFKRFQSHKTRASLFLRKLARENPGLFVHWKVFGTNTFA